MKLMLIRAAVVLVPSWTVAAITDKMVWVVPMVVASALGATAIRDGIWSTRFEEGTQAEAGTGVEGSV